MESLEIEKISEVEFDEEQDELMEDYSYEELSNVIIYSSDWTVETILNQVLKGNININPKFQRRDAWKNRQKSKLIESLLLSIPVPNIVLAEKRDCRGSFDVIDGKQRLLSIIQFCKGKKKIGEESEYKSFKLTGLKLLEKLNGKSFEDLKKNPEFSEYANIIENATIRTSVIRNSPSESYLYEIFSRLNTGSLSLSPQELRQSLFPGKFTDFIDDFANNSEIIHELLKIDSADKRMRDTELIMRSYAYKFFLTDYPNSLKNFLDDSCQKLNKYWSSKKESIINFAIEIENAIKFTKEKFGQDSFKLIGIERKNETFNRVIFDLMIYYFSEEKNRNFVEEKAINLREKFVELMSTDLDFQDSMTLNTHQTSKVEYRFKRFRDFFGL